MYWHTAFASHGTVLLMGRPNQTDMSIYNLFDESHEDNSLSLPTYGKRFLADRYGPHPETIIEYLYRENAFLVAERSRGVVFLKAA